MTLQALFGKYHRACHLSADPLVLVRNFSDHSNIEVFGLTAAVFSYGRVEQIIKSLESLLALTRKNVVEFSRSVPYADKKRILKGWKHRFNDSVDAALLLQVAGEWLVEAGSIEAVFLKGYRSSQPDIGPALHAFTEEAKTRAERISGSRRKTFDYLFPSPESGSACKRLNMYLRWMVRKDDGVDLGVWKGVSAAKLIIPVDTHIEKLGRRFKLTRRTTPDWKMAQEITASLRRFDPHDPVKYDFALCSAGKNEFRNGKVAK